MCGRFFLSTPGPEIARHFELDAVPALAPHYNVAPGQPIPVVRAKDCGRVLELRLWGLVPGFAEGPRSATRPINARAESAATAPLFRTALARRRGLVPADGFYEWQRRGRSTRPFAIRRRGGGLFALAALYERWRGPDGDVDSCAILTVEANATVQPIHGRMPLILGPESYARWLDPALRDPTALALLLAPYPAGWLESWPVERRVNDVREDDAALLEPERDLFSPRQAP